MEIRAKTIIDYKTMKKFNAVLYPQKRWLYFKTTKFLLAVFMILIIFLSIFGLTFKGLNLISIFLMLGPISFFYLLYKNRRLEKEQESKHQINEYFYIFRNDEFSVRYNSPDSSFGIKTIDYLKIKKIFIFENYIYIFLFDDITYILNSDGIYEGTASDLLNVFAKNNLNIYTIKIK